MYYLLMPDPAARTAMLAELRRLDVDAVFHYVPLHSSPGGRQHGRVSGSMRQTDDCSLRLLRLPLWPDMSDADIHQVIDAVQRSARLVQRPARAG